MIKSISLTEARKMGLHKLKKYNVISSTSDGLRSVALVQKKGSPIAVHKNRSKMPFMVTIDPKSKTFNEDMIEILAKIRISKDCFFINGKIYKIEGEIK